MTDAEMVTLRDYIDTRLTAMDKALELALETSNARLESMNRFREQLREQAANMVTRAEYETAHRAMEKQIADLRESRAELAGKASAGSVYISYVIAALSLLIGLVALVHGLT